MNTAAAKTVSTILGIIFIVVGALGFYRPMLMGTHLSIAHNLIHLISGAVALYFGMMGSFTGAKYFCILFGVVYFLLGVAGFVLGAPGIATVPGMETMGSDKYLFPVLPGTLELGMYDHILHVGVGLLFFMAGLLTKIGSPKILTARLNVTSTQK
jgi:hypothetical protein